MTCRDHRAPGATGTVFTAPPRARHGARDRRHPAPGGTAPARRARGAQRPRGRRTEAGGGARDFGAWGASARLQGCGTRAVR